MTEFRRQSSKLIALPGDQSDWDAEELARPLRTSSQGRSRSNQPPRLIDQNAVGLVERVEADESALRSLSSEFTHINSRWSRLEKPFSNSLEDPTSNMTAVQQKIQIGTSHHGTSLHRRLFRSGMPCSPSALLENRDCVTRTPARTEQHNKLIQTAASPQLTDGENQSPVGKCPVGSPRSLLCVQLEAAVHITPVLAPQVDSLAPDEKPLTAMLLPSAASPKDIPSWHGRMNANMAADVALASTQKDCPDQSECEDVAVSLESGKFYRVGSANGRTDNASARCNESIKPASEALFPASLSNVASVVTDNVLLKGSGDAMPLAEAAHCRVRRRRASGYAGKMDPVDSQILEYEAAESDADWMHSAAVAAFCRPSVHSGTAHSREEYWSGISELLTLAGNAHEGRQHAATATNEVQVTPVLAPRLDTFASDEKPLTALHLPSPTAAASPNDTPNWHGRMNANMGADVHKMHQTEANESEEQPAANITTSQPENECRAANAMWHCDDTKGHLTRRTPRAMRNVFGSPTQQQVLNSPSPKVQNECRTAAKEQLLRCVDLKRKMRTCAPGTKRKAMGDSLNQPLFNT